MAKAAPPRSPTGTSRTWWRARWSAHRRPPSRSPPSSGWTIATDDRLIESAQLLRGQEVSVGDGALRNPRNWWVLRDPFTPSWGEAYLAIAPRMFAAVQAARVAAEGHEAVCVSHQLPIWTLRRYVEHKRLWHDPRRRPVRRWPASPRSTSRAPRSSASATPSRPRTWSPCRPTRGPAKGRLMRRAGPLCRRWRWPPRWPAVDRQERGRPDGRRPAAGGGRRRHGHRVPARRAPGRSGGQRQAARRTQFYDSLTTAARSWWSTSGAPGARRAGPRRTTWSRRTRRPRAQGVSFLGRQHAGTTGTRPGVRSAVG